MKTKSPKKTDLLPKPHTPIQFLLKFVSEETKNNAGEHRITNEEHKTASEEYKSIAGERNLMREETNMMKIFRRLMDFYSFRY